MHIFSGLVAQELEHRRVELWARGLAIGMGLDVMVDEPDVSPLAIQGPKAQALMTQLFGDGIVALGHFRFGIFDVLGTRQLIARSGYSKQGGYEIYLQDSALGSALWDLIWDAGAAYNIRPGCPNLIERIEGGLMSYGNEFTRDNNPLECGFGPLCHLGDAVDYIGKAALRELAATGPQRMLRGIKFGDGPSPPCGEPFPVTAIFWGSKLVLSSFNIVSVLASNSLGLNLSLIR